MTSRSNYTTLPQGIGVTSKTDCLFTLPAAASFVVLSLYILVFLSIPGNYAFSTGMCLNNHVFFTHGFLRMLSLFYCNCLQFKLEMQSFSSHH